MDLLVVGAGPAGMSVAITARRFGLDVMVVDDQPAPGGQIWRSVERTAANDHVLGATYVHGRATVEAFRASGAVYMAGAQLWRIEHGYRAYLSVGSAPQVVEAPALVLATGAQERPVPFPGWTTPGVLTVGAAQILLKSAGEVPKAPVWIAGSGPLPLLYATQLLRAGGTIAGYLDTTPAGQWRAALRHLPRALLASSDLAKGLGWMAKLRKSGTRLVNQVSDIEALGSDRLEAIRFRHVGGREEVAAEVLLVHEGVIPNVHAPMSLDCEVGWNDAQDCYVPVLDLWGEASQPNLFVAGDGAGIAGAKAALLRGELTALRVAVRLGRARDDDIARLAHAARRKLRRELSVRPFLDALYRPRPQVFAPRDETIICRCEEVTAGEVRRQASIGRPGPNQIKTATRAGMGPCQGRQCGYTVTRLLCAAQNRKPADVGYFHVRPPLKPVTLGELAATSERVDQ